MQLVRRIHLFKSLDPDAIQTNESRRLSGVPTGRSFGKGAISLVFATLILAACSRSVEGTYKVINGPVTDITVTLGKSSFAFSSGASGTYEVVGNQVVFSGMSFAGTMKIDGRDLVNDKWRFAKQ